MTKGFGGKNKAMAEEAAFWGVGVVAFGAFAWAWAQHGDFPHMWVFGLALLAWGAAGRLFAIKELRAIHGQYEKLSMVDESTGVLSKSRIVDALARELRSAKRNGESVSVVMIEAMNIMDINQNFDRLEGDATLAAVAMASGQCLRDTDYLGRSGGLIFCALLPATAAEEADMVLKRMASAVCDIARSHPKGEVHVKCRLARSSWDQSESFEAFLSRAESILAQSEVLESDGHHHGE